jgi:hypothetical protein
MHKIMISFLTVSALTGCGEGMPRLGSSQAYLDGYEDGCANGSSTAGNLSGQLIRNEARYNSEPDYATGWSNGNRECNGENLRVNPNNPMEQIDIDGPR